MTRHLRIHARRTPAPVFVDPVARCLTQTHRRWRLPVRLTVTRERCAHIVRDGFA